MDSYDDIVKRMKDKFTSLAGYSPDDASDIGIRMKVLAGEIYSIGAAVEWLRRQTFAQTAEGNELNLRAQERGLSRKAPVAAYGTLTFQRATPLWFVASIPAGTVCSTAGNHPVRYITTRDAKLPQGSLSVDVPAKAETAGNAGNTQPGTVTVMVTPPPSLESVTNGAAFIGGEDSETDDSLRARLLACCAGASNGCNPEWYRQTVLQYDGVDSVGVVPRANGAGTVALFLGGKGCAPSADTVNQINTRLNEVREIGVCVTVAAAQTAAVDVTAAVTAKGGVSAADAKSASVAAVRDYFLNLGVGDPVVPAALVTAMFATGKLSDCQLTSAGKAMAANQLAVCGSVTITAGA